MPQAQQDPDNTLTDLLAAGIETFLKSMAKDYFCNPSAPQSRMVVLKATAIALRKLTASDPTARATLRTFALEILDTE